MRSRLGALLVALLAAGCSTTDPSHGGLQQVDPALLLDYNSFVCDAQPVLIRRCSYLGCHGNANHALRVYSPGKLRAVPSASRDARDGSLTADEVAANFASASALNLLATPQQRAAIDVSVLPLLSKPLAARFGGAEHHGVAAFPAWPAKTLEDDPDWAALADWVAGSTRVQPLTGDCADVFSNLGLQPR